MLLGVGEKIIEGAVGADIQKQLSGGELLENNLLNLTEGQASLVSVQGEERKAEIDFTDAYLDSNLGVAVKSENGYPTGDETALIEALNDSSHTVAVQAGTTGQDWAEENLPDASIVPLASVTVCMTGVSTGQYDAFCADLPVIGHQCTVSFTDCEIALEIPTGEQYGIVVSKDNPGLTAAINAALADMEADGSLAELKEKWFGVTD